MALGKLSLAAATRAPLWVRLAVFGVIGAMLAASIAATIGNARGFATDQFDRGEAFGRTAVALDVANETQAIRDKAAAEIAAANLRQAELRAKADADLAELKSAYDRAILEAETNDPTLADFLDMRVPDSMRDRPPENRDGSGPGPGS